MDLEQDEDRELGRATTPHEVELPEDPASAE
jgi:hypothetical protein